MPDVQILLDTLNELTAERNAAVAKCDEAIKERDKAVQAAIFAEQAAKMLIARVHGDTGRCKGCLREIYWVRHREGAVTAYNKDGTMHVTTCANAKEFTRGPRQASLYEGVRR